MAESGSSRSEILRTPKVLISIVVLIVVIIVWALAYYFPARSTVSKNNAQLVTLQSENAKLTATVAGLQRVGLLQTPLTAKATQLNTAIPLSTDTTANLEWIRYVYAAGSTAGLTNVSVGTIAAAVATPGAGAAILPAAVTVSASGTYDQQLTFIKLLYNLPRLTTITTVSLTGGGPGTNRTTMLTANYNVTIYTTSTPIAIPTVNASAGSSTTAAAPTTTAAPNLPECGSARDPLDPTLATPPAAVAPPSCLPPGVPTVPTLPSQAITTTTVAPKTTTTAPTTSTT